jgi:hypothetical protein
MGMKVNTIEGSEIDLVPGAQLDGEMLRDLDLRGVDLANSILTNCFFNESLLSDSNLRNCDLSGSVFYRTDLSGADLSGAIFNDCYFNEVRYSKATKWPSGFQAPERRDPLEDVIIDAECSTYDSGLCTIRELEISGLLADIKPLSEFKTGFKVGPVKSTEDRKRLLLRLAHNLSTGQFAIQDDGSYPFLPYETYGWESDEHFRRNVVFTHVVLMLRYIGIQFHEIKEDGSIIVSFEIENNVGEFLEKDLLAIFEISGKRAVALGDVVLYSENEAESFNLEDDLSSLRKLVNKIQKTKQFKERIQKISGDQRAFQAAHSIDFSDFNDPDEAGLVSLVDYAGPVSYTGEEKLILGMLAYTNFASEERTLLDLFGAGIDDEFDDDEDEDEDEEFLDEEDEDEEEDPVDTINCEFHRLAIRLLGIVSIEESTSGVLKAVIRPEMSLPTVLKELGYEVGEDSEDGIEDLVFHPTLGLFDQAFEF